MLETLLSPAYIIGQGYDVPTLAEPLLFAINNRSGPYFGHMKIVPGMDRSFRIFGGVPFEGSVPFPQLLCPDELAAKLVQYSNERHLEDQARYTKRKSSFAVKG